jgi:hypothetical protein
MEYSSTLKQMQKREKSRGLDVGAGYATGVGSGLARTGMQCGDAHDCDSSFLADRGYLSGAPLWVGPGHPRSAQS